LPDFDVAGDPALRATLRAARAWGVPLSVFLGRKQVTTHEYLNGQPVRSTTEPLWLETDRSAAMALELYEADLCTGCGQPMSESTLLENEEQYQISYEYCHGCVELDEKGFVLTGKDAAGGPTTLPLETSRPRVFAVGDVRGGSTKRVAAAVGEGAAVVAQIHASLS